MGQLLSWQTASTASVVVCCLAGGSTACDRVRATRSAAAYSDAYAAFVSATADTPPGFPRLTGGLSLPSPTQVAAGPSPRLLEALARIERDRRERPSAETLGAAGAAALRSGATGEAVKLLQRAAAQAPEDPRLWSDLAAAFVRHVEETGSFLDLADALEAGGRAAELAPEAHEPACNRALALERAHLQGEAARARRRGRDLVDGGSPRRAGSALERLEAPSVTARWERARRRLYGTPDDPRVAADLVAIDPQAAREEALVELLADWGERYRAGDGEGAARALACARAVGVALVGRGGDATVLDATTAIERSATDEGALDDLARGHIAYRRGFSSLRPSYLASAARPPLSEAATLLGRNGSPVALWAEKWLAVENLFDDRFPALIERFDRLLEEAEAGTYPALVGRLHWGLGMAWARQGDWMESLFHFRRARAAFAAAGERENLGAIESLIGEAEGSLGRSVPAWIARARAAGILCRFPDSRFLHNALWQSAEALAAGGRQRAALLLQEEDVRVARRTGDPLIEAESVLRRSRIHLALDRPEEALEDLREARRIARLIAHPPLRERLEARLAAADGEARRRVDPGGALRRLDRAVEFYEGRQLEVELAGVYLGRARVLRELGRPEAADRDLEAAAASLERQRRRLGSLQLGRSFFEAAHEVFDEWIRLRVETLGRTEAGLVALDRARLVEAGSSDSADAPARVAGELPAGVEMLEYALVQDRLYRWRLRTGRIELEVHDAPEPELYAWIDRFVSALEQGLDPASITEGANLSHLLLPNDLESGVLVVVPDRRLARVPFAALPDPATRRPLVDERTVVLAPSGPGYLAARARAAALGSMVPERALVIGDPAFDRARYPGLADLPGARAEAAAIAGLYSEGVLLNGGRATGEALRAGLPAAEVLHFAGHAVAAESAPAAARLVLAPSAPGEASLLSARDLVDRDLSRLRLAVFSACSTAAASERRTTLLDGVASALLDAGVSAIVGTLWPVPDEPARELLVSFHRAYRESGDPAASLAFAQRLLIHHPDPRMRTPAAWAAFVLVGADNRQEG